MTQDLQVVLPYLPRRQEETERNHRMEQMTLQIQGGLSAGSHKGIAA